MVTVSPSTYFSAEAVARSGIASTPASVAYTRLPMALPSPPPVTRRRILCAVRVFQT